MAPVAGAGGSAAGTAGGGVAGASGGGTGGGGTGATPNLMPTKLSETGLFKDMATQTLADGVFAFTPQYPLWSDTAGKRRWVYLPPGKQITTDGALNGMEFWEFPEGFKLWKEFERDGKVIETRLLHKQSAGLTDWYMVAFRWNDDLMDAVAVPDGEANSKGTMHDIPGQQACTGCHSSMYDNALGFSALQLSHTLPGSINLTMIDQMGWLSKSPTGMYALPGTEVEKKALGYMHSNCGMCHNQNAKVYTTNAALDLWSHLDASLADVRTTRAYLSLVCDQWPGPGGKFSPIAACDLGHATGAASETEIAEGHKRVAPKSPATSAIYELMNLRVGGEDMRQMPPLGTEMVDAVGLAEIDAWINSLPSE